ncbi:MAG: glycosyltransferase family 2 protein [Candidatus Kuenenbacteria bacterium]
MKLSIIIVSWNVREYLKKCLESIFKHTQDIDFEVIVVDNASKDNSAEMVQDKFPEANLIANKKNLGFARANNQGIGKAQGKYILILNDDTELIDNSLKKLIDLMEKNQEWAIAGCRLLNSGRSLQKSVRRFPKFFDQFLILVKLHHLPFFKKYLNNYLAKDFDYTRTQQVDQIMGAFMMVRKSVFEKIGKFDEKYFYWFEEVDLCKRAVDAGLKVFYTPQVSMIHHGGVSFCQVNWHKQIIWNHSVCRYFWKHSKKCEWLILWFLGPVSVLLAILSGLFKKSK